MGEESSNGERHIGEGGEPDCVGAPEPKGGPANDTATKATPEIGAVALAGDHKGEITAVRLKFSEAGITSLESDGYVWSVVGTI